MNFAVEGHRGKKTVLSIKTKQEIINRVEGGETLAGLGREYGVNKSTIATIVMQKAKIRALDASVEPTKSKADIAKTASREEIDEMLMKATPGIATLLSVKTKKEIIAQVEKGERMSTVAKQFGLNKSIISKILAQKAKIKNMDAAEESSKMSLKIANHEKLRSILYKWVDERTTNGDIITMPVVQKKAREILNEISKQKSNN